MTAEKNSTAKESGCAMNKIEQLKEYIIQDVVGYIVEDADIEYDEAMNRFYTSQTFDKLQDSQTGLYLEGSAYVYGIYQHEEKTGSLKDVAL